MRFNNNAEIRQHAARLASALAISTIADRSPKQPLDVCKTCISTAKMRAPDDLPSFFPVAVLGASKRSPFLAVCIVCRDPITETDAG
jgi:hypothetical protein